MIPAWIVPIICVVLLAALVVGVVVRRKQLAKRSPQLHVPVHVPVIDPADALFADGNRPTEDDIAQAEALMRINQVRRLPVIDLGGHVVAILSLNDIAREVQREKGAGRKSGVDAETLAVPVAAICEPRFICESSRIVDLEYVE